MSDPARTFQVVGDRPAEAPAAPPPPNPTAAAMTRIWLLSMQNISQRFVTAVLNALSASFTAAAVASAWWLWSRALPNPTAAQIVLCALYAAFILLIDWQRRRK